MLYRKFYKNAETNTLLQLYISFIRPHLEYCSAVWDPYLIKDMETLEKTQKFGLRVCLKDWSSDYTNLLSAAKIPTLSSRRSQARLTHIFKIIHQLTDFPDAPIVPSTTTVDLTTLWPSNHSSAGHHNSYTPSSHELHLSRILYLRVWSPRLLSLLLNILYMLLSNYF